jgi:hypothetical protein
MIKTKKELHIQVNNTYFTIPTHSYTAIHKKSHKNKDDSFQTLPHITSVMSQHNHNQTINTDVNTSKLPSIAPTYR